MQHIEVFADIVCPFTHVGLRRLREVRPEENATRFLVRAWPLEWVNGTPLAAELAAREIDALRATVAPDLFAGFDPKTFPRTSIPAFGLAAAAYRVDDATGEAVSFALRDALFEHGQDVSDSEVLKKVGWAFGLDRPDEATAEAAVREDWKRGVDRGVQGSPHFFVGDRGWFCPSLDIHHRTGGFDISVSDERLREFRTTRCSGRASGSAARPASTS